jgi:hypothetical protein
LHLVIPYPNQYNAMDPMDFSLLSKHHHTNHSMLHLLLIESLFLLYFRLYSSLKYRYLLLSNSSYTNLYEKRMKQNMFFLSFFFFLFFLSHAMIYLYQPKIGLFMT